MKNSQKPGVLFWSGGKDAWLALQEIRDLYPSLHLLVTYDVTRWVVPIQEVPLAAIVKQADKLGLPLISLPLPPASDNTTYIRAITATLRQHHLNHSDLIFGDLHIEEIRKWREETFEKQGYSCRFPIWKKPYELLFDQLFIPNISIEISSVDEPYRDYLHPGMPFTRELVSQLPSHIDPMGENGEFHTLVRFLTDTN